jgi:hypothetical protein
MWYMNIYIVDKDISSECFLQKKLHKIQRTSDFPLKGKYTSKLELKIITRDLSYRHRSKRCIRNLTVMCKKKGKKIRILFSTALAEKINFLGALERFGNIWPAKACIAKVLMDGTSHIYYEKFVSHDVCFFSHRLDRKGGWG